MIIEPMRLVFQEICRAFDDMDFWNVLSEIPVALQRDIFPLEACEVPANVNEEVFEISVDTTWTCFPNNAAI